MIGNSVAASATRSHGIYKVDVGVVPPENPLGTSPQANLANKPDSLQVRHERLSHQNKKYVRKFLWEHGVDFIDDDFFCEACLYGKQSRMSFGLRT